MISFCVCRLSDLYARNVFMGKVIKKERERVRVKERGYVKEELAMR